MSAAYCFALHKAGTRHVPFKDGAPGERRNSFSSLLFCRRVPTRVVIKSRAGKKKKKMIRKGRRLIHHRLFHPSVGDERLIRGGGSPSGDPQHRDPGLVSSPFTRRNDKVAPRVLEITPHR